MLLHQQLLLAYTSGLLAAVSPCVIVLVPLCLVRFVRQDAAAPNESLTAAAAAATAAQQPKQSLAVQLLLFLLGFQLSYLVFGFALASVLTSFVQTGFKLGLGLLFVVASVLAAQGRVDPLRLPLVQSAWWTGVSFALLLSFNPCVVPFLAALLSLGDPASVLLSLLCFAQGLITPALLVVALGSRLLTWLEQSAALQLERVKPFSYAMLGCSGAYLLLSPVYTLSTPDLVLATCAVLLSLKLVHGAAEKPASAQPTCKIMANGELSCQLPSKATGSSGVTAAARNSMRRGMIIAGAAAVLLLFGASIASQHDQFTHAAADSMMSAPPAPQTTESLLQQQLLPPSPLTPFVAAVASDASAADAPSSSSSTVRMQQLRREMSSLGNAEGGADDDDDHLDQHALEAPSIRSYAEQHTAMDTNAAVVGKSSSSSSLSSSPQLTAADLAALEALAAEEASMAALGVEADAATCVDLSQLPPCFQCSLLVALYRGCAVVVALAAATHQRIIQSMLLMRKGTRALPLSPV